MKIKIGFMTVLTLLVYLICGSFSALGSVLAAILHEFGHIGVAKWLGVPFRELNVTPFGASLTPSSFLGSYTDELMIAAAGPFVNLLCVCLIWPWVRLQDGFLFFFFLSSLFLSLLNLLPVAGFDGGRILSCFLCRIVDSMVAERILSVLSFAIVFGLWSFSVYLLLRVANSLSLFVFSCSLFLKLFVEPKKIF